MGVLPAVGVLPPVCGFGEPPLLVLVLSPLPLLSEQLTQTVKPKTMASCKSLVNDITGEWNVSCIIIDLLQSIKVDVDRCFKS